MRRRASQVRGMKCEVLDGGGRWSAGNRKEKGVSKCRLVVYMFDCPIRTSPLPFPLFSVLNQAALVLSLHARAFSVCPIDVRPPAVDWVLVETLSRVNLLASPRGLFLLELLFVHGVDLVLVL